ncbi:DNA phosphorothioation system sulfurtransferase DndC [Acinetobacter junii]|uniref:DNA phosphorothioation system sulfurtransferase DndC n=1 Tax=Acinetobacter junii TaxID=40215 RepID=UPI0018FFAF9A|nr:DNA phosphorothioation system sulfurtransferase DndC [Acinetobacter junii]MBJ8440240.1 DNA phosphorothioation system sulfurtransferase DndC [Acinetobacter junii]
MSFFDTNSLSDIYSVIQKVYLSDKKPWVVGYSGGKDSTCTLQLVWNALAKLPQEKRQKPVYVISSDTLVETPVIVRYIDKNLENIQKTSDAQGMPFIVQKVSPRVDRSFWVNLLGRGYPAPSNKFRWCTERLKIEPANEFITQRVAEFGEVIVVLGVRSAESATRAQVIAMHKIEGSNLARHSSLPNAFVFAPIESFTTDDVWNFLLQNASPWNNNNRELVTMYRNAQAGECPLVVDKSTPSCGNSRFGCWVCTVVQQDKSMEAMVESGEEWLEPLLEFRDLLSSTQDPDKKYIYREVKRRNGQVAFNHANGKHVPGPYKLSFCKELLTKLLETQKQVQKDAPIGEKPTLIHANELHEIRRIWRSERGDWADSIPKIVHDTLGIDLDWHIEDSVLYNDQDYSLLNQICQDHDIPTELLVKLIDVEKASHGLKRRHNIHNRLAKVLNEEWRDLDTIIASRESLDSSDDIDEEFLIESDSTPQMDLLRHTGAKA